MAACDDPSAGDRASHAETGGRRLRLAENGHRLGGLIETIVTSPQFLNQRGKDAAQE